MVEDIAVNFVFIAAVFILSSGVIADNVAFSIEAFVENFSVQMKETPIFKRQMRDWILSVGHSGLEMSLSVDIVEPNSKFRVSDSWASICVKIGNSNLVGQ